MPMAALWFSPLALMDRTTGMVVRYSIATAGLVLMFVLLRRMTAPQTNRSRVDHVLTSIIAVTLALQFVLYDLDDGGPQAILLTLLIAGAYAVWRGRARTAAVLIGLAAALKVTPLLFILFFAWKRQYRLAAMTLAAFAVWVALPILWMGPSDWWSHQQEWTAVAAGSAVGQRTAFAQNNEDNIRNSNIQHALMRYLTTYPPGHTLRVQDPAYVAFLDVPTTTARAIAVAAAFGLLALFAWQTRMPFGGPGDPAWVWECSALLVLMLLLSPLTWIQHLPWLLPALYLIVLRVAGSASLDKVALLGLVLYGLIAVVLNYEVLGKRGYTILLTYKPYTIGMLLVLALVFHLRPRLQTAGAGVPVTA